MPDTDRSLLRNLRSHEIQLPNVIAWHDRFNAALNYNSISEPVKDIYLFLAAPIIFLISIEMMDVPFRLLLK